MSHGCDAEESMATTKPTSQDQHSTYKANLKLKFMIRVEVKQPDFSTYFRLSIISPSPRSK